MSLACIKNSLIIFIFSSSFCFAQDWQPIDMGWKYNYKLDASAFITNTIWIDSTEIINGDSVSYLNRIVIHCDTCTASLGGPNPCDSCYALKNQPQFLQIKVTELANGIFYFNDTAKIVINSMAALNDTWLFDSINNITAQVIAVATDSVFGNIDSVKTILFTSGDTIKLSMNYGILQYPHLYGQNSYYRLAGIEGANVGEKVSGFWEIFDFNVGDVFHYRGGYFDASAIPPVFFHHDRQYIITSKNVYLDSVSYDFTGLEWGYYNSFQFNFQISGTLKYYDSTRHFANFYNHQLVNTYYRLSLYYYDPALFILDTTYDYAVLAIDSNGVFSKSYGNNSFYNNYIFDDSIANLMNIIDLNNNGAWLRTSELKYKVGLGQTDYSYIFFEHGGEEHLIGYIKNGDTSGVVTTIPVTQSQNQFSFYPNPAIDKINIQLANISSGKIFITDNTGRKILEKNFNDSHVELNVSTIPTGFYFLSVQNGEGMFSRKIIIERE